MVKHNEAAVETSEFARAMIADAGLAETATRFPEDVAIAMATAEKARKAMAANPLSDVAAEPWPAMRMRGVV